MGQMGWYQAQAGRAVRAGGWSAGGQGLALGSGVWGRGLALGIGAGGQGLALGIGTGGTGSGTWGWRLALGTVPQPGCRVPALGGSGSSGLALCRAEAAAVEGLLENTCGVLVLFSV